MRHPRPAQTRGNGPTNRALDAMTASPRRRVRISKGIYRDAHGLAAIVEVRGQRKERRFPGDFPVKAIQDWRRITAGQFKAHASDRRRKLLKADVDAFLADNATMPSIKSRTVLLHHWLTALGNVSTR